MMRPLLEQEVGLEDKTADIKNTGNNDALEGQI